ncbi:MAG: hypothetical protein JWN75_2 [Candidatus Saccharibacteria bacterium]|nr:hypothetical protein [Candidatus Saccharibacteria bacterium]
MKIRNLMAVPMAALGVLAATVATAPLAQASTCVSVGGSVPSFNGAPGFGGNGGGCDTWTPAGNHIMCGSGFAEAGYLSNGGGGCRIVWTNGFIQDCDVSVHVLVVRVDHVNPCPSVP